MLKIFVIGDPHFQPTNIPEVTLLVSRLEETAIKCKPDLVVILGDILHTHEKLHTTAFNMACNFIDRMRKIAETIILVGNHDMVNNQQFLTENHWMNPLKMWDNITIVDKVFYKEISGFKFKFLFVPYVFPGRFQEALNTVADQVDFREMDVIFSHQEFAGAKMGAITSIDGDRWSEKYPYVVSGHIHSRQNPQVNIYYCGTPLQHAFGESGNNTVAMLSFSKPGKKYSLEEIDLGLPGKKIIYTDVAEIQDYVPKKGEKDQVKITVSGNYEEFKSLKKTAKYKEIIKTGTKIVFKPKKITVEEKTENPQENEADFQKILAHLVLGEKNVELYRLYELIINNKVLPEDEQIILL